MACTATKHGSVTAYREYRCRCPEVYDVMRPRWRRHHKTRSARRYADRAANGPVIDEIAVERACDGDPVHLTPAERAKAVALLDAKHVPTPEIARRLRVTQRTVQRRRAARRQAERETTQ